MTIDEMFPDSTCTDLALFEQPGFLMRVWVCALCGAVVFDTETHFEYHEGGVALARTMGS
jgi:hypothetical protein